MPMDDRITLVPNEYYRNGTPKIDEITVAPFPSATPWRCVWPAGPEKPGSAE